MSDNKNLSVSQIIQISFFLFIFLFMFFIYLTDDGSKSSSQKTKLSTNLPGFVGNNKQSTFGSSSNSPPKMHHSYADDDDWFKNGADWLKDYEEKETNGYENWNLNQDDWFKGYNKDVSRTSTVKSYVMKPQKSELQTTTLNVSTNTASSPFVSSYSPFSNNSDFGNYDSKEIPKISSSLNKSADSVDSNLSSFSTNSIYPSSLEYTTTKHYKSSLTDTNTQFTISTDNDMLKQNAYGPGIHMNQFGQPVTLRPDFGNIPGQQLQIQENAYGLGVHMDQFGRPVREYPAY